MAANAMRRELVSWRMRSFKTGLLVVLAASAGCRSSVPAQAPTGAVPAIAGVPLAPPARWLPMIGEYGPDSDVRIIAERAW